LATGLTVPLSFTTAWAGKATAIANKKPDIKRFIMVTSPV
jgi:hypothetical protein